MLRVAIRREDKNEWERRAPLTPDHVRRLVEQGVAFVVQPSERRIFPDAEYAEAGAEVREDIADCQVVLAVKEIPPRHLLEGRTYLYFSHTIKGQPYNMPMLRHLLEIGADLIDYECITDDQGLRLIAFGEQAGQAGMIDTLWALGRRLDAEGLATPLLGIEPAWAYASLDEARAAVRRAGERVAREGLGAGVSPITIAVLGHGRVAAGAWDILAELPIKEVLAEDLPHHRGEDPLQLVKLYPQHYVARRRDGGFDFDQYCAQPELYEPTLERHLPFVDCLVNGIYWDPRYPKLLTREQLRAMWSREESPALRVIGDITCDIRGALDSTVQVTTPDRPTYLYLPDEDAAIDAWTGTGPLVLAVDNLPAELPRDASRSFGDALAGFVRPLADAHADGSLDPTRLPAPLARALITHRGSLTEPYRYLTRHLPS
jgi:alpha-aminoadipic semialdehyde synthase